MAGKQSGRSDAEGSLFQSGNKLELVGPGRGGSEQASVSHTFSRIYDAHASDREVFTQEVQPLVDKFVDELTTNSSTKSIQPFSLSVLKYLSISCLGLSTTTSMFKN